MAREVEARNRFMMGLFVVVSAAVAFISLFIIGQTEGSWETKTFIRSDFRTITGLRKGSPVQLAGVEIGAVDSIDFVNRVYACDPLTEDLGRFGGGRTDNCDAFLFCSPDAQCAELEKYASKAMHAPCLSTEDCGQDEVCVTRSFRRRARRVFWTGPDGVCARYSTEHRRVQVNMKIFETNLELIRSDSRATVASNGVLGDQLVNITPGMREALGDERRIQSTPSLYEDIELFRERIDGLTDKVDSGLSGISSLFSELNDESTISAVKGTLEHVDEITRQIAEGEGLIGALLSDEEYKQDFGQTLRGVRDTAMGVDRFVGRANNSLAKIDKNLDPAIDDISKTMADARKLVGDLRDPSNKSLAARLLYDKDGKLVEDVERIVTDAKTITADAKKVVKRIEAGQGTLGKLVNDSKPHDELVKLFRDIERSSTLKRLTRMIVEMDEKSGETARR